ncbi:MAG: hypothetical protein RMJ67_01325 [Elusimicrobiota bacterium]|nr:hypothetical protein [Endomicrobiia bacterium]MDW8165145.1 hypothetical protein [Elusimicrobiota bacterium]
MFDTKSITIKRNINRVYLDFHFKIYEGEFITKEMETINYACFIFGVLYAKYDHIFDGIILNLFNTHRSEILSYKNRSFTYDIRHEVNEYRIGFFFRNYIYIAERYYINLSKDKSQVGIFF